MNIFSIFSSEKFRKISSKTHQIAPFKKIFPGKHVPEPPSKRLATTRVASSFAACNSPSPQKVGHPLANHTVILPWTTTKKFI